ncbi:MAG: hypothetical protein AB7G88_05300 [Thermomicrobiales bacterium]
MSSHCLSIYIQAGCTGSRTARAIATAVETWDLDGLVVEVIDLDEPDAIRPRSVFAVPTYQLDGALISLGNPDIQELHKQLVETTGVSKCLSTPPSSKKSKL